MAYYEKFSQSPGFNFAFEAGSPEADKHARTAQYGSTAIMFLGTGVKVYHEGDKQDQVVFWGQDVDPRSMVLITLNRHDERFCVRGHPMKGLHGPEPRTYRDKPGKKFYDEPEKGEGVCVFQHEDISRVTDWVQKNWRQYSKVITGW